MMESSSLERLILLVECPICFEKLNELNRMLPCQHTFCKQCLERVMEKSNELRCPECRTLHTGVVKDLHRNILVMRVLEYIEQSEKEAKNLKNGVRDVCSTSKISPVFDFQGEGTSKSDSKDEEMNSRKNSTLEKNRSRTGGILVKRYFGETYGEKLGNAHISQNRITSCKPKSHLASAQIDKPFDRSYGERSKQDILGSTREQNSTSNDDDDDDNGFKYSSALAHRFGKVSSTSPNSSLQSLLSSAPKTNRFSPKRSTKKPSITWVRSNCVTSKDHTARVSDKKSKTTPLIAHQSLLPQKMKNISIKNEELSGLTCTLDNSQNSSPRASRTVAHLSCQQNEGLKLNTNAFNSSGLLARLSENGLQVTISGSENTAHSLNSNCDVSNSTKNKNVSKDQIFTFEATNSFEYPRTLKQRSDTDCTVDVLAGKSIIVTPPLSQQLESFCEEMKNISVKNKEIFGATSSLNNFKYLPSIRASETVSHSSGGNENLKLNTNAFSLSRPLGLSNSGSKAISARIENDTRSLNWNYSKNIKNVAKDDQVFTFQATNSSIEKPNPFKRRFLSAIPKNASGGQNSKDVLAVAQPHDLFSNTQSKTYSIPGDREETCNSKLYSFNVKLK